MTGRHRLRADVAGERLDVFLARRLPDISRAHAQRLIADGFARVDGSVAKPSLRVEPGMNVEVEVPDRAPPALEAEAIPLAVVYEDSDVLVVDKPAGMAVHPGPGNERSTLVNALLAHSPALAESADTIRPGIVHRLDKDTSGLIVVAKTDRAQLGLAEQMAQRTARKEYLALVKGRPQDHGTIEAPIGRHPGQRKQMAIVAGGRPARTHFRVLGEVGDDALLLARLDTGRTHQIRVHVAGIGHPVLGDVVYGTRSDVVARQFLHAWRLGFTHPATGAWLQFEAPLPDDLAQALRTALARAGCVDVTGAIDRMMRAATAEPYHQSR